MVLHQHGGLHAGEMSARRYADALFFFGKPHERHGRIFVGQANEVNEPSLRESRYEADAALFQGRVDDFGVCRGYGHSFFNCDRPDGIGVNAAVRFECDRQAVNVRAAGSGKVSTSSGKSYSEQATKRSVVATERAEKEQAFARGPASMLESPSRVAPRIIWSLRREKWRIGICESLRRGSRKKES